jgi:hypothetical protein
VSDLSGHWHDGVEQTWKQLYEREHAALLRMQAFPRMLSDLDRNANGRHEGDIDGGVVPGGVSAGNPHLTTGDTIGYDIGGNRYVVPRPDLRGDIEAWREIG